MRLARARSPTRHEDAKQHHGGGKDGAADRCAVRVEADRHLLELVGHLVLPHFEAAEEKIHGVLKTGGHRRCAGGARATHKLVPVGEIVLEVARE